MKQRCRRQQPSPPSQVLRRAPFWVLFFLSFLFFLLILSCCVSVCVCVFVSACACVSGCNSSKDGVSVCSCPLRALLCIPLPSIVNSCLLVHSWLMVGGWSGDVCVCLWGVGKGWSYPTTSHSPFFIGGEGGDWHVYRRRFGEETKVSCARRFLCSYWWADSQWGGDGRCLKLHLLSVTLLALQLQDTSLCFATTKRKKKENFMVDHLRLLPDSTRKLIFCSAPLGLAAFSSSLVDTRHLTSFFSIKRKLGHTPGLSPHHFTGSFSFLKSFPLCALLLIWSRVACQETLCRSSWFFCALLPCCFSWNCSVSLTNLLLYV